MVKILVIDDEKNARETMRDILEEKSYDVIVASSGKEGLSKANSEKPEIVLVDTKMPEMDGFETCKKIKQETTSKVIIYTAKVDAVDSGKARVAGADEYIVKTEDIDLLLKAIKKIT